MDHAQLANRDRPQKLNHLCDENGWDEELLVVHERASENISRDAKKENSISKSHEQQVRNVWILLL